MDINVEGITYKLTYHAKKRMGSRGVKMDELIEALENTKKITRQVANDLQEERRIIVGRNRVSVVVTLKNVIVTVYNFKKEFYRSKSKQKRNTKQRKLKQKYGNRVKK